LEGERVVVRMTAQGLRKELSFRQDGSIDVAFAWTPRTDATWFTSSLSVSTEPMVETDAAESWQYPIETVAKSEKGFDRTVQGLCMVLGWPAGDGHGRLRIRPPA